MYVIDNNNVSTKISNFTHCPDAHPNRSRPSVRLLVRSRRTLSTTPNSLLRPKMPVSRVAAKYALSEAQMKGR